MEESYNREEDEQYWISNFKVKSESSYNLIFLIFPGV